MAALTLHDERESSHCGFLRSPVWRRVELAHLQAQPGCACCGDRHRVAAAVQVHHIFPFHYCVALGRADLELDHRNLITLCETEAGRPGENHHLLVGHLGSFQSANLGARRDAALVFHAMDQGHIRSNARWLLEVAHRIKPLAMMTAADRHAFAALMNARLPKR